MIMASNIDYIFTKALDDPFSRNAEPQGYSETLENGMIIERHVAIPLRDKRHAFADIWRPEDESGRVAPLVAWTVSAISELQHHPKDISSLTRLSHTGNTTQHPSTRFIQTRVPIRPGSPSTPASNNQIHFTGQNTATPSSSSMFPEHGSAKARPSSPPAPRRRTSSTTPSNGQPPSRGAAEKSA